MGEKKMTRLRKLMLAAAAAAILGACSSTPIAPPPEPKAPTPAAPPVVTTPAPTAPAVPAPVAAPKPPTSSPVTTVTIPAHLDPRSPIAIDRSAFFDFDKADLKPEFSAIAERHGKYLIANPKIAVRVEGNTDERGSREYNLALGQKRAEAVRQALKIVGVAESRIEAMSWGEERPRASGHDDAAWSQNRRADIQYPNK
jgi:peptidoglycan-associated lipoprotein